ncbi:GNAT family N-acetyltransferase [Pararhizobium sp.]|uniref:GNAT family N-acetyltransferase n=1 Tax=Pararhizobium sp. TaxID=1977563 RepID=UPI003D0B936A
MSATSVLKAGDIVLRPATEADIDARLAFGNDADIAEMYGKNRSDIRPLTRDGVQDWVGWLMSHPHAWIIEKDGSPIGEIRLDNMNKTDRRTLLALGIFDPSRLGQGIGPVAIALVLAHAFGTLNLHRVSLRVLAYNSRAIRAYEKCGFRVEGRERETAFVNDVWHDDLMMGILCHEFADPFRLKSGPD